MSNKINKTTNKTKNLELDVKDKERELEALKEALEKGNLDILNNLHINLKSTKNSTKVPKKLSEKEKEKRDEIRRLKEAEDLAQIQQKLFRQVKGRKKIEPLYKKSLYTNMDVFANNIEKECEKVFPKEEKHKKIEMLKSENMSVKNNYINNTNSNIVEKSNILDRKNISKKFKINCDINNENDEVKDKEYLSKLDKEIKSFYIEKSGKIFNFLKEIHLCRYIDEFLKQGYDLYEEFIEIPDDFFQQMNKPFLNKSQQEKFYNKLHSIKNKYKQKISQNYKINQKDNKNNINNKKNINSFNDKYNINNNKNNNINNNIDNNINNTTKTTEFKETKNDVDNISILEKNENINNNKNIIKDTSSKINEEELMYKTSAYIDELEKQRSEEFKKAVEKWRSNNPSRPNTSYIPNNNKITSEMGININIPTRSNAKNNLYCWNCYKKFLKGEGFEKEYNNNYNLNSKYNTKNFCSLKCIKEYEKKQKSQYMCFECRKMCNIIQGFIAFEGEKFCSVECKNKYIQEEKENAKKKNKVDNKKDIIKEKEKIVKEDKNNNEKNDNNNDIDELEEDSYDPMDDF